MSSSWVFFLCVVFCVVLVVALCFFVFFMSVVVSHVKDFKHVPPQFFAYQGGGATWLILAVRALCKNDCSVVVSVFSRVADTAELRSNYMLPSLGYFRARSLRRLFRHRKRRTPLDNVARVAQREPMIPEREKEREIV